MEKRKEKLIGLLQENFGYDSFRLEQENIINSILDGIDTMAIMPTGGGKSLCYQIPALYLDGVCLVISPLISLMQDQVLGLQQNGIEAAFLNSTQSFDEKLEIERKLVTKEIKILYLAPEAIHAGFIQNLLNKLDVSLIAVDEAHCVSQWGHEFRADYTRLCELRELCPSAPMVALTATADKRTRKDIANQLKFDHYNEYISSFDRPNIKYLIAERTDELKQLHDFIQSFHKDDTGIVYCLSRKKVEKVAEQLRGLGYNAIAYHAGLSSEVRTHHQNLFNQEEKIIVVATVAFGMGIDRPDVRFVAHLDLPKSVENYYQETGRAGRDGNPSNAWMIYGLADVVKNSRMIEMTEAHETYKKFARHKLDFMLSLCESTSCRRKQLLGYFAEKIEDCGNCDNCLDTPELFDATVYAQKFLSTVYHTGEFYGAAYLIDILRGSKNAKVLEKGHDRLSVYGIGKEVSKDTWNVVIRQLLTQNFITIKNWEYRNFGLMAKCSPLLKGEEKFYIRKLVNDRFQGVRKKLKSDGTSAHGRDDLFEKLRSLRREISLETNVPPYVIFGDKSLHDMCLFLPKSMDDLLMVYGVGKSKQEKYGEDFLRVIKEYQV